MSQDDQILFTLSTTSLSHLSNMLSSLSPVGAKCLVIINEKGLFFVTNDINISKIQLILVADFFDSFVYESGDDSLRLMIDINSLIESVTIANTNNFQNNGNVPQPLKTNCILSYQGYGHPFVLSFEDDRMLERVEFQTFNVDSEDDDSLEIDNDKLILEIILKGSIFYEILKEMKEIQTEQIYIYCDTKANQRNLIFISKGELGYSKLIFPQGRQLLENIVINKMVKLNSNKITLSFPEDDQYEYLPSHDDSITCFYNFDNFSKLLKLSKIASKVKLKKDSNGITSVTLLLKDDSIQWKKQVQSNSNTVIEFKLLEMINPLGNDQDENSINQTFNNKFIENLIHDDDVIQLNFNHDNQAKIDEFLPRREPNIDIVGGAIEHPIFL